MAKILADEQFPARIQDRLRRLGHDVKSVRNFDDSKSGDGKTDLEVLSLATAEQRILLTLNRKHFWALHETRAVPCHEGIIAYTDSPVTVDVHADRIDAAIKAYQLPAGRFTQKFIMISASGDAVEV